jgi:hypothetical protein
MKKGSAKANSTLILEPAEFFKQKVSVAIKNQNIRVDQNTEHYLVNLLNHFMHSENYFIRNEQGEVKEEVLALLLADVVSASESARKLEGLKRIGDISLYTAGFFSDSLMRKVVDVDYYIGMGQSAYASLASAGTHSAFQRIYSDLADRFHKFVDILSEISQQTGSQDPKNLLRLYELWLKTKSERVERQLKESGIVLPENAKKNTQQ